MKQNSYSPYKREQIKQRDGHQCFYCESKEDLTIAHIFVWRIDGGLPLEINGLTLCRKCHDKLDFGIGVTREEQIKMLRLFKAYLMLTYDREIRKEDVMQKVKKRCK